MLSAGIKNRVHVRSPLWPILQFIVSEEVGRALDEVKNLAMHLNQLRQGLRIYCIKKNLHRMGKESKFTAAMASKNKLIIHGHSNLTSKT